jgi:hypothetical protein
MKKLRITTVLSGKDIEKYKCLIDLEEFGTTASNFLRLLIQREYDKLSTDSTEKNFDIKK